MTTEDISAKPGIHPEPNTQRVFPLPGTTYYNMLCDPKSKQQYRKVFRIFNRFVAPMYRLGLLPLLGAGNLIVLATTRGRKSGKWRQTPVGCFRYAGGLYLISGWGAGADWFRNMQAHPDQVYIQEGFHRFHAHAELVQDPEEFRQMMKWLVVHHTSGMEAKAMGWDPKRDNPETADFSGMFRGMAIVRLQEWT
jgi:deazaflavin-dependent oxidoreductase (nitroreductase family)